MGRQALAIGVVVVAQLCGVGLAAQDPARAPTPDTLPRFRLDSLVIQALRTPIELGSSPFAISVLGRDDLVAGKALVSLQETLQGLPGVQVQARFNDGVGDRISIRGFGGRAQFGVRGIKVLVDGIPATLADGQATLDHLDLPSLGRVEALRGPASALYGGAAGGVLIFESRPAAVVGTQEARVMAGSDGYWRANGQVSGPAGSGGYLVSAGASERDGYRTNPVAGGTYGTSSRVQANGRLTGPVAGGEASMVVNVLAFDAENPGSLSDSLLALGDRQAFRSNVIQGTAKSVTQGQMGARWMGPLASGLELDATAYGLFRTLDNPIPGNVVDLDRQAGGARAALAHERNFGDGGRVRWSAGAEVDLQRDDRRNFENEGGEPGALTLDQAEKVTGSGVFTHALLETGDRWSWSAGLRYDRTRFTAEDAFTADGVDDSGSRTMDALSPSFGASFRAHDELTFYGNVATAFQTPTTTELANRPESAGGFNADLDPANSVSGEVGMRGRLGQRVTFEVAAFRTTIRDELVPFEVASDPGRTFFRNAGESTYEGVEIAVFAAPSPGLRARATYSYLDAVFSAFAVDGSDFSGNRVPGSTPHRFDGTLGWWGEQGFVEAHAQVSGATPVNDANSAEADGYQIVDLRAGLSQVRMNENLTLSPFAGIENVFDQRYVSSVVVNAFGRRYFEPGPGRRFHVGVSTVVGGR